METIIPVFVVCIMPMILLAGAFVLGRWSVKYDVRVERRGTPYNQQQAPANNAYKDFYEGKP